jgi:hypothetical protein
VDILHDGLPASLEYTPEQLLDKLGAIIESA